MGCVLTKEAASLEGGNRASGEVAVAEEGPSCSTSSFAAVFVKAEEAPGTLSSVTKGSGTSTLWSTERGATPAADDIWWCGASPTTEATGVRKWPPWLWSVAAEALEGWSPCDAGSFEKLAKIGTGTYSNVYKARDLRTGELVALKKVRVDSMDPDSVQFMAREITLLRRLGCHPNVVGLRGIATSRVSACGGIYLVFDYMEHDLAGLAASPDVQLSLAQIKCYMRQLLSGLAHCHSRGVLHRDIKGANLLVSNDGVLKIADFGLACAYEPGGDRPMTSRVVTLWYRAPELLLGATRYGPGVDLWSAGCVVAELLAKQPILPGRTEVDQLNKIFKLCGCPPDGYWDSLQLPTKSSCPWRAWTHKSHIRDSFSDLPPTSLPLIETLLSVDPAGRGTAADALNSQFFTSEPYPSDPASLPQYPPTKEIDVRAREEKRTSGSSGGNRNHNRCSGATKRRGRDTASRVRRAVPVPATKSDVGMPINRNPWKLPPPRPTSNSEKFPPPHRDTAIGASLPRSQRDGTTGTSVSITTTAAPAPPNVAATPAAESSRARHPPPTTSDAAATVPDKKAAGPGRGGTSAAGRKNMAVGIRSSRVAPSQLTSTLRKPPFGALMDLRKQLFSRSDGT